MQCHSGLTPFYPAGAMAAGAFSKRQSRTEAPTSSQRDGTILLGKLERTQFPATALLRRRPTRLGQNNDSRISYSSSKSGLSNNFSPRQICKEISLRIEFEIEVILSGIEVISNFRKIPINFDVICRNNFTFSINFCPYS